MFAGGLAMAASTVYAQQVQAEGQPIQRVEVTGSRIPTLHVEGTSPVTVVGAQEIKMDGVRSVENMLNNLPQVFADQGASISNGASGTATVNLRNLGADRTLVLVNGRRLPAGSPQNTAADLNQIPAPLIKRVEVLTGGAGAVYGSDAVAGVVNFIMNDRFKGVQLELNHSFYNHQQNGGPVADAIKRRNFALPGDITADGKITDANLLLGSDFADGKGNATVFFNYKKEDPLLQSERDFSACSIGGASRGAQVNCGGSITSYPGLFDTGAGGDRTPADANGNVRPWSSTGDIYNFGPLNYFQRPSERYGFNAFAHYNVNENTRVYAEASFHDDHTVAQIAPSGLFGVPVTAHYENPLLSPAWRSVLGLNAPGDTADVFIFRRNVEGGGRQDNLRHTSYRGVLGLKGDIGKWNYDAYAQMGKVLFQENYLNDFSISRSEQALDVIADANGNPVCRNPSGGCVPYNIWALDKVSPEALKFLQTPGFQKGFTSQSVLGVNFGTDLAEYGIKMPTANEGVAFNVGFEHRTEKLEKDVDTAFATGDLAGQGGPTPSVKGEYSVRDVFIETRVPLLSKHAFADDLSLNGSFRRSDYSTGHKTNSFGVGVQWAPTQMAKVRASYQKAVRAANVVEMFAPSGLGLYDNDADPCAGATPTATPEQCARTGVTAAMYGKVRDNPAGQYNAIFGGNENLNPETSKSYTLGLVVTPMANLSFTFDYFNIKVNDVIDDLPPTTTLSDCIENNNQAACALIQRDSLGSLWMLPEARIIATNMNLGMRQTSGLDIASNYRHKLNGMGSLDFALTGTYLKEFLMEDAPGKGSYDCAGLFGSTCGTPLPEWRHKLRGTWMTPWGVDLALTWRYMGKSDLDRTSTNKLLAGTSHEADRHFDAQNYFDIAASWNATRWLTVRGGINNLVDKDPPVGGVTPTGVGNGNTFPQVYDALGRRVFINLTAKF